MKRTIAVLLLLILPPAVYFPTLAARRDEEMDRMDGEVAELEKHIEMSRAAQRKLTQFRDEVRRLDEELAKMRVILPPRMSIDEIGALCETSAARNGVRLTIFAPAAPKATPPLQEQPVRAEVVGSVEGTAAFLRDLQNEPRVIDVSSVTLRRDAAGWRTDFIMTCYAMPDPR